MFELDDVVYAKEDLRFHLGNPSIYDFYVKRGYKGIVKFIPKETAIPIVGYWVEFNFNKGIAIRQYVKEDQLTTKSPRKKQKVRRWVK